MGEDGGEYAALPRNSAVGPLVTNRSVSCHAMPARWCAAFAFTPRETCRGRNEGPPWFFRERKNKVVYAKTNSWHFYLDVLTYFKPY